MAYALGYLIISRWRSRMSTLLVGWNLMDVEGCLALPRHPACGQIPRGVRALTRAHGVAG